MQSFQGTSCVERCLWYVSERSRKLSKQRERTRRRNAPLRARSVDDKRGAVASLQHVVYLNWCCALPRDTVPVSYKSILYETVENGAGSWQVQWSLVLFKLHGSGSSPVISLSPSTDPHTHQLARSGNFPPLATEYQGTPPPVEVTRSRPTILSECISHHSPACSALVRYPCSWCCVA